MAQNKISSEEYKDIIDRNQSYDATTDIIEEDNEANYS